MRTARPTINSKQPCVGGHCITHCSPASQQAALRRLTAASLASATSVQVHTRRKTRLRWHKSISSCRGKKAGEEEWRARKRAACRFIFSCILYPYTAFSLLPQRSRPMCYAIHRASANGKAAVLCCMVAAQSNTITISGIRGIRSFMAPVNYYHCSTAHFLPRESHAQSTLAVCARDQGDPSDDTAACPSWCDDGGDKLGLGLRGQDARCHRVCSILTLISHPAHPIQRAKCKPTEGGIANGLPKCMSTITVLSLISSFIAQDTQGFIHAPIACSGWRDKVWLSTHLTRQY